VANSVAAFSARALRVACMREKYDRADRD